MKKIILLFLFMPILSACSPNLEQNNLTTDISEKVTNETQAECANIGEHPNNFDFTTGKKIIGGKQCCPGLKEIINSDCVDDICSFSSGGPGICAPCGNDVCEQEYENSLNCPEDCL
jgi:hypothetical protein